MSVMSASVVTIIAAIYASSQRPTPTLAGSMMPAVTMSLYAPSRTSWPSEVPVAGRCLLPADVSHDDRTLEPGVGRYLPQRLLKRPAQDRRPRRLVTSNT
jgi:hypothetical protein